MPSDFGVFEPIFESPHEYLALLHLPADNAGQAIALVKDCCRSTPNPFPDIRRLLADPNWRPHLVAAVAVFISGYDSETVRLLWRRVDLGSWVTPQICATLSVIDPDFLPRTRLSLEAGCPLDASELRAMTPIERHSAAGPAGSIQRSAKTANALVRLVRMISPQQKWIDELQTSTDLQNLLSEDFDAADQIAEQWLNRAKVLVASLEG